MDKKQTRYVMNTEVMNTEIPPEITGLIDELGDDVNLKNKIIEAYKTKGKIGVISLIPDIVAEIKEDIVSINNVKAGYKTTEFWLIISLGIINTFYTLITNNNLPLDVNATLGGSIVSYIISRTMVKK